ncbi:Com family DNA-binding transcriptional regulator [Lysinibacillus capsici]|uniref:Com family DNA-binding transcriptional regulator n=1 Tax=Lysinibacillus capsici TaxID=2115968 RepID=UPI0035CCE779
MSMVLRYQWKLIRKRPIMKEIRCAKCSKLLLKTNKEYEVSTIDCELEVQCTRCKAINHYKVK